MNKCGDCYWWMKSKDCPREKNVNGFSRGPSMSGIACGKFSSRQYPKAAVQRQKFKVVSRRFSLVD